IYSDEDKITRRGKRLDPYFKPDFDYELLLSQNMVSHLGVYRTSIVRNVGGFRIGYEGSQDYDLVLRVLDKCDPNQIHHIPRPLYHWRMIKESAARNLNVKPYAIEAATKALNDHFIRRSVNAEVQFLPDLAGYNVSYAIPKGPPSVSIIIPGSRLSEGLYHQVDEILNNTQYINFQINLGLERKAEKNLRSFSQQWQEKVHVQYYKDEGTLSFAQKVNQCVSAASSDFICLLDESLTGFIPGWLSTLIGQATQPGIGVVGPKLINVKNNRVLSNGIVLMPGNDPQHLSKGEEKELNGYFGWAKLTRGYSAISEKCILVKLKHFIIVGGFNEEINTPIYCGIDFCLKLRELGYRNILRPLVKLYIPKDRGNYQKIKTSSQIINDDKVFFIKNWKKWTQCDPGFNPNLTIIDEKLLINLNPNS
ncbi:MAG: glycosyltransferase family 2 protein, partial [Candidatus Helarchaeota archaeon]